MNAQSHRSGRRAASAALAAALAIAVAAGLGVTRESRAEPIAASGANPAIVYFTRGEFFATVRRDAAGRDGLRVALRALAAGPTPAERRRGLRTSIPRGTRFLGVDVEDGVAVVNFSRRFASGRPASIRTRLAQVVFTATAVPDVTSVRIALEGRVVREIKRVAVDPPLDRADYRPPPFGGIPAPPPPKGPPSEAFRRVQERLIELGYLPRGAATGLRDERTKNAVVAFQKWEGLARDGIVGPQTRGRLARATRPVPARGLERHIEVDLRRQVALLVERGRVARVLHVSTGAPASPTPRGSFRVFRKELRSWSIPFRQWLPYASYFTGGIAFHEYAQVPVYPASHGCVRVPSVDAKLVYRFARYGTRVVVY